MAKEKISELEDIIENIQNETREKRILKMKRTPVSSEITSWNILYFSLKTPEEEREKNISEEIMAPKVSNLKAIDQEIQAV